MWYIRRAYTAKFFREFRVRFARLFMKKDIHPQYFPSAVIACACGNSFKVGSTKEKIEVEICSACHPFFTGKKKIIDTAGRVEKFEARRRASTAIKKEVKPKKSKTNAPRRAKKPESSVS